MATTRVATKSRIRRSEVVVFGLVALLAWGVWFFVGATKVPNDQAAAGAQLERPLLFYDVWDGTPYVVFELVGVIHFDHLILDPVSISWPPAPRWQFSGMWESLEPSTEPASAGLGRLDDSLVIFGQVNDARIVRMDVLTNHGGWQSHPVTAPGYAVQIGSGFRLLWINWLDDAGNVVYSESYLGE